jgi:hypothetical protein
MTGKHLILILYEAAPDRWLRSAESFTTDCDVENLPHEAYKQLAEEIEDGTYNGAHVKAICIPEESGDPVTEIMGWDARMDDYRSEFRLAERERAEEHRAESRMGK